MAVQRPYNVHTPDQAAASSGTNLTGVDVLEVCELFFMNLLVVTQQTKDSAGVMLGAQHIYLHTHKRGRSSRELTRFHNW